MADAALPAAAAVLQLMPAVPEAIPQPYRRSRHCRGRVRHFKPKYRKQPHAK